MSSKKSSEDGSDSDRDDLSPSRHRHSQGKTNLYVENFDKDIDESKLCKLFSEYGSIVSCIIPKDDFGRSKRHGFVNFSKASMAQAAIDNLNGKSLENEKPIYVGFFQNKNERRQGQQQAYYEKCKDRNLYVGNLDESIDNQILREAFAQYGAIVSAKVMTARGQSKGYGFVCFTTADEAKEAIANMNGKELGSKPIYVAVNKTRESTYPRYTPRNVAPSMFGPSMFAPIPRLPSAAIYPETSSTLNFELPKPSIRGISPRHRFSTRLSPSTYSPVNRHSPVEPRENSSSDFPQQLNRQRNTSSSDETTS